MTKAPFQKTSGRVVLCVCTFAVALLANTTALAQQEDPMLIVDDEGLRVRGHLQGGVNAVAETNLFWNLSDSFAPEENFDPDTQWLELYFKPGMSFIAENEAISIYGKVSGVPHHDRSHGFARRSDHLINPD